MVNRAAILLKYKDPAIQWINDVDPYDEDPGITKEYVNSSRNIYLISEDDAENEGSHKTWVERNYKQLFVSEIEGWYTDPSLWPSPVNLELFNKWFDVECHSIIIDTVGGEIFDDGI